MIQEKNTFNNGLFDCQELYSDNGKKILETTNGQLWNTDYEHPIAIAVKRRADYVETDEPIEPIVEVEPKSENQKVFSIS